MICQCGQREKILHPFSPLAQLNWNPSPACCGFNFWSEINMSADKDNNPSAPLMFCQVCLSVLLYPTISFYFSMHNVPSATFQAGFCYSLAALCWVSWDVFCTAERERCLGGQTSVRGAAASVAWAPPGLVHHFIPLYDLCTQSQRLIIT